MARLLSPIIISTNVKFSSKAGPDSRSLLLRKKHSGDNNGFTLVRRDRIYRRFADRYSLSTPATGEASELVAALFGADRRRGVTYNCITHFQVQFVGVHCRGVLVVD